MRNLLYSGQAHQALLYLQDRSGKEVAGMRGQKAEKKVRHRTGPDPNKAQKHQKALELPSSHSSLLLQ